MEALSSMEKAFYKPAIATLRLSLLQPATNRLKALSVS